MLTLLATTNEPAPCPICGRPSRITIRTQRDDAGPGRTVITGPECAACMAALQPLADEAGRVQPRLL